MQSIRTPIVAMAGEALIDLIRDENGLFRPCLGGAPYNLARALARQGVEARYLNPLSKDAFGRQLAAGLDKEGVRFGMLEPVTEVTSLAVVGVNHKGQPEYSFYREGVADRAITAAGLTQACGQEEGASIVCTGALALSPSDAEVYLPWLVSQRDAGRLVVIDANLRPSVMPDIEHYRRHVMAALQLADVIKVSDEDLECLGVAGDGPVAMAQFLLSATQAHFLALTRGGDGATLLLRSGQIFHARQTGTINIEDTVGAGDCFLAGLIASLLDQGLSSKWGESLADSRQASELLLNAVASASICVTRKGCSPPLREEVKLWLSNTKAEFTQVKTCSN